MTINRPGDEYEQEADRIANQVMRMPEPTHGSNVPNIQGKIREPLQLSQNLPDETQAVGHTGLSDSRQSFGLVSSSILKSQGRSMDPHTLRFMESRFGRDFSNVQIHTGFDAGLSAKILNARAFTIGQNIVFGSGEYAPGTFAGNALLAHELVHTIQQAKYSHDLHSAIQCKCLENDEQPDKQNLNDAYQIDTLLFDESQLSKFLLATARAQVIARHTKLVWEDYNDSSVINAIYSVMGPLGHGKPGVVEVDQGNIEQNFTEIDIEYLKLQERLVVAMSNGPESVTKFLKAREIVMKDSIDQINATYRDGHKLNEEIQKEAAKAVARLSIIKASSTIVLKTTSALLPENKVIPSFWIETGYDITLNIVDDWDKATDAKMIGVVEAQGKDKFKKGVEYGFGKYADIKEREASKSAHQVKWLSTRLDGLSQTIENQLSNKVLRKLAKDKRRLARVKQALKGVRNAKVLLVGNHDQHSQGQGGASLNIYRTLGVPGFVVGDKLTTHNIETRNGKVQVITLPWLTRSTLMTRKETANLSLAEVNELLTQKLQIVLEGEIRCLNPDVPTVLLAHLMADNATLGAERLLAVGKGFTIPLSLLARPCFDYVALGHIHKHQNLNKSNNPPIIYPGSIERVDFSEEEEQKGYVMVKLSRGKADWEFCPLPARVFYTIKVDVAKEDDPQKTLMKAIAKHDIKDAVVRLIYQLRSEQIEKIDTASVHTALSAAHNYTIQVELVSQLARPRIPELVASNSIDPRSALKTYLDNRPDLKDIAASMIEAAEKLLAEEP